MEQKKGFAAMDPARQREIASRGGRRAHERGVAHQFDHKEAVAAGRKGGAGKHRVRYTPPTVTDETLRSELIRASAAGSWWIAHLCRCALGTHATLQGSGPRRVPRQTARRKVAELLVERRQQKAGVA